MAGNHGNYENAYKALCFCDIPDFQGGENVEIVGHAYGTWCFLDILISRFPEWQPGITKLLIKPDVSLIC